MQFMDWSTGTREKNQTEGNNLTHFHLLRANSVPYSIPNKNSTLSKIPRHWELSLKEYNTLYVIIEMARGTVVHIGQHLFYLENHKAVIWTGFWWPRRSYPANRRGRRIPGHRDEWEHLTRSGNMKKNCTKYKKGLRKRPIPVKGPLFLKQSSPWITAFI